MHVVSYLSIFGGFWNRGSFIFLKGTLCWHFDFAGGDVKCNGPELLRNAFENSPPQTTRQCNRKRTFSKLYLIPLLSKDIGNNTWARGDMEFIFECSRRYRTSERRERVRYRINVNTRR